MNVAVATGRFVFLRPKDFVCHVFSDGVVVYDEADGSVQALTPVAGEAWLACKRSGAIGAADLAVRLELDDPSQEELASVSALLGEFVSMGFLEQIAA